MKKLWFKSLLAGLVLSMGLVSCFDEKMSDAEKEGKEEVAGEGEGFISFGFDTGATIGSRAEAAGTNDENRVENGTVILYSISATDTIAEYVFGITANNGDGSQDFSGNDVANAQSHSESNFVTTAKRVKEQDYMMVVLLNPVSTALNLASVGSPLSAIRSTASPVSVDGLIGAGSVAGKRFFMSNYKGATYVPKSKLKETASAAENAPVEVVVDRAVAKISVNDNIITSNEAEATIVGWQPGIVNTKTYWMRVLAPTAGGTMETATDNVDRKELYAYDPNFSGFSDLNPNGGSLPNGEFINPTAFKLPSEADYVTENTMVAEEQYEDVTTRVVFQIEYIPKEVDDKEDGFYVFGTELITVGTMLSYINNSGNLSAQLKSAITNAVGTYITAATGRPMGTTSFETTDGLKYYANCICYYAVPIRHFDDITQPVLMAYGRYGVVRNNWYVLTVNSVSFPGSIAPPDPEGPDDKDPKWIAVDIQIQDWFQRGQGVEL